MSPVLLKTILMKSRFTLAVLLLLSLTTLKAQDAPAPRKEIALQLLVRGSYLDYDLNKMVGIGIHYGKHSVSGGLLQGYFTRWDDPVDGMFLGYNFYPDWHFKRLSGHAIFQYQHLKLNRYYEFAMSAGYGLDFRLLKNLYFDQSFTVGAEGMFAPRRVDFYYYGNHNWDFITTLQFGLRYEFELRKGA